MSGWTAIKDQMPPRHQTLLFYCSNGDIYQGRPCYGMHEPWFCGHSELNFGTVLRDKGLIVTHWREMLDAPSDADALARISTRVSAP